MDAVRTGTLVDATLIPSASVRADGEARWAGHRRRKPVHGYKAHVATDEGAGLVRGVEVTTANVHDAAELERVLPPKPGDVYGDSAFTGEAAERLIIGRGGRPRTVWTGSTPPSPPRRTEPSRGVRKPVARHPAAEDDPPARVHPHDAAAALAKVDPENRDIRHPGLLLQRGDPIPGRASIRGGPSHNHARRTFQK